jgi:hypothetical protein
MGLPHPVSGYISVLLLCHISNLIKRFRADILSKFQSLLRPSQASHLARKTIRLSFYTVFKVTSAPKFCGLYRKPLFVTILTPFFFYYCEKDEGAISWNISYKILCFERAIAAVISFECGNGPSGCIKRGRFQYLFKQDSAPRTWLVCS